jgi:glycosyltransferase involved in cell wall biosynthesis
VLYAYWNKWGTEHDQLLLPRKKWKAICISGSPSQKPGIYFLSRLIHKISVTCLKKTGSYRYFADFAIARSSYFLIKAAKKHKADLYIGHNLGALPAIVKASVKYKKPCGFDAEDFHRHEVSDDASSFHYKLTTYIEDRYLPHVNYITASSPLIAERYSLLYNRRITSLLNVFSSKNNPVVINDADQPIRLFWFSQTIGPNRGLELIIEAMGLAKINAELHLLGHPANGYKELVFHKAANAGLDKSKLYFYKPVPADEIFALASQFDIGLASETGFCINNNLALSNKIFTYILSGLAVAASNTPAQAGLVEQYPQIGKVYRDAMELSAILKLYNDNRALLSQTKKESFAVGQSRLNWETESQKLLAVVQTAINFRE